MKKHVEEALNLLTYPLWDEYEDDKASYKNLTSNFTRGNLLELIAELSSLVRSKSEEASAAQSTIKGLQLQLESTQAHASELGKLCESLAQNQRTLWQSRHTKTSCM